jgi:AcrR family transcriptional regulator
MAVRDAAATKERILEAAFEEFSTRGFAGSRVDDIADKARCNKALLYQYYGDKESLFRQVLQCKMAGLQTIKENQESFAQAAGEFFDFYAANPTLLRMQMWEALDYGSEAVPNEKERTRKFDQHVERLVDAQNAGTIDPALDPRQTLVSLIGMIQIWFSSPQIARMICGGNPYTKDALKRRRAHVMDAARRILETR